MRRISRLGIVGLVVGSLVLAPAVAWAATPSPGAPGAGDAYYPLDGNGGYDVQHYDLGVEYNPANDQLKGLATIVAKSTQDLSRFDLDLVGLNVRTILVQGKPAKFTRTGQELVVTPSAPIAKGKEIVTVVAYDGVPKILDEPSLGENGFFTADDGAFVAGQPHGAATWYPVSDHPTDKATYSFRVTVPKGLDVTANGRLAGKVTKNGKTTWLWVATEPQASYLSTIAIGNYEVKSYKAGKLPVTDAIDSKLFVPFTKPRTGTKFAYSQVANSSYKRLTRTIAVPAGGAKLGFQIARDTEEDYDFAFVEAHTVGAQDWTTLPDANGHTSTDTGGACAYGTALLHPFLQHYQTLPDANDECEPTGTSGKWNAVSGASNGYEAWSVDLGAYAGKSVEVSITYVSDDVVQGAGVAVDDVVVSTGTGSTSFENGLDGWTVAGAPAGSPGNDNDWVVGGADLISTLGDVAAGSLAREPEIIKFLESNFGPYPFSALGGIVVGREDLGFALETQTRPIYSPVFFGDSVSGDSVVVHELTHQWYGDSLAVNRWKDIWLNEGFATYAEWLWSEHEGLATAQEQFDARASIPADDDFWNFTIGDPGPDDLFAGQVYDRGGMTLHALRLKIGDAKFFQLLRTWAAQHKNGNVSTPQFVALAEKISGQKLGSFFDTWLYTPAKPAGIEPAAAARTLAAAATKKTSTASSVYARLDARR